MEILMNAKRRQEPKASIWKLECSSQHMSVCLNVLPKSKLQQKFDSFETVIFCCSQIDKLATSSPFYQHNFTFLLTPHCSDERSYGWLKKGEIASPRFKISGSWDLCYVYIITVNFFLLFCLYRQAHPTSALSPAMSWGELLAHSKTHMAVFFGHYYIWVSRVLIIIYFDKY